MNTLSIQVNEEECIVQGEDAAPGGSSLLKMLKEGGADVPSLCYHPALGGDGRCGLCVVEVAGPVEEGVGDVPEWRLQLACQSGVYDGMRVRTDSPQIRHARAQAAQLLLMHGPFSRQEVADQLHSIVHDDPAPLKWFEQRAATHEIVPEETAASEAGCILCGLCIRMCARAGKGLLTFLGRSQQLRVAMVPYDETGAACGRCRACRRVCPTGFIEPDAAHTFTGGLYR